MILLVLKIVKKRQSVISRLVRLDASILHIWRSRVLCCINYLLKHLMATEVATRLRSIMLLVRNVPAATAFYAQTLGLPAVASTPEWSLLAGGDATAPTVHILQVTDAESPLSVGYSPIMQFAVADLDAVVPQALMAGASLDGAIKYTPAGKVAVLRSPPAAGGHMISLVEPDEAGVRLLAAEASAASASSAAGSGAAGVLR